MDIKSVCFSPPSAPLPPTHPPHPPKKSKNLWKMLQCWKSFINIHGVHFSPPSACLTPPPTPLPAVFPLSLRSRKTILSRADAREDQSETALPATRPRKTDRVARGPGHPTTAESWIALPATLPRKDKVSRGRGHPTTQRVGLHCLRPSQERRARFQEDGGILLLQRVGLHCLRPSQERWARFQEDGGILLLQRVGSHRLRPSQERQTRFQEDRGILLLQRVGGLCVLQTAWSTSHTQLHDNPTSSTMMTHIQLHNSPDLRHTPDELGPAGCRCGSTGGNYNLYIGTWKYNYTCYIMCMFVCVNVWVMFAPFFFFFSPYVTHFKTWPQICLSDFMCMQFLFVFCCCWLHYFVCFLSPPFSNLFLFLFVVW